jgi:small subunit ribosomal protein S16
MLVIRLQRTGRKGHAMFRIVVQDSRRTPTSGKVVARLGSYDPHVKVVILDKEKASLFIKNGAQPSDRMVKILHAEKVKLPDWVTKAADKKRDVKNPEKRRSTAPAEVKEVEIETLAEVVVEEVVDTTTEADSAKEAVAADSESTKDKTPK